MGLPDTGSACGSVTCTGGMCAVYFCCIKLLESMVYVDKVCIALYLFIR